MSGRCVALGLALVAAAAAPARADDPLQLTATAGEPARPPRPLAPSISQRLEDELTLLGETLDAHLQPLTFDALDLRVDGRARRARLRLGTRTRYLSLRLVGDVRFRSGLADVDAAIDLGIAGTEVRIELPAFELVPRSYLGERYVEVRVPLLKRSF